MHLYKRKQTQAAQGRHSSACQPCPAARASAPASKAAHRGGIPSCILAPRARPQPSAHAQPWAHPVRLLVKARGWLSTRASRRLRAATGPQQRASVGTGAQCYTPGSRSAPCPSVTAPQQRIRAALGRRARQGFVWGVGVRELHTVLSPDQIALCSPRTGHPGRPNSDRTIDHRPDRALRPAPCQLHPARPFPDRIRPAPAGPSSRPQQPAPAAGPSRVEVVGAGSNSARGGGWGVGGRSAQAERPLEGPAGPGGAPRWWSSAFKVGC